MIKFDIQNFNLYISNIQKDVRKIKKTLFIENIVKTRES